MEKIAKCYYPNPETAKRKKEEKGIASLSAISSISVNIFNIYEKRWPKK